jgi:PAS domain S-box-containing protein
MKTTGATISQADDFDLNEIFADYFISEFEDPHNAYTNAMANYVVQGGGGTPIPAGSPGTMSTPALPMMTTTAAAPVAIAPQPATLPTGGIRSAYHASVAAPALGQQQPQQQQFMQQQQQQPQEQAYPGAPIAKKPKIEFGTSPNATVAATGGVTTRLGVPMPSIQGGHLGIQTAATGGITLGSHQLALAHGAAAAAASNVALPVGVGIRLGGAGGVAPAMAQNASRVGGIIWGGPQMVAMSDHAIAERRQRNREHAKRSRVRKKFMLEGLQEEVSALQRENQRLRLLVQDNIPEHAQTIITECCTSNPLFSDEEFGRSQPTVEDESGEQKAVTTLVRSDFQLMDSLSIGQQNFVLSDPRLPDNPIVFATPGFYKLTGYTPEQVLGRNCRFLQGPGTDPKVVDIIRKAIATGSDCTVCILNYKADGTPFWNQFFVAALRDADNCIVNYVSNSLTDKPLMVVVATEAFLIVDGGHFCFL